MESTLASALLAHEHGQTKEKAHGVFETEIPLRDPPHTSFRSASYSRFVESVTSSMMTKSAQMQKELKMQTSTTSSESLACTQNRMMEAAIVLENGTMGWQVPEYGTVDAESYMYYRLWRSPHWKFFCAGTGVLMLLLIFIEPIHSTWYGRTEKNGDNVLIDLTSTRVDRVFELICILIAILDLLLQYKALGMNSFHSAYFYTGTKITSSKTHYYCVALMLINTFICIIFPACPLFTRVLRPYVAMHKHRNVEKIMVAIVESIAPVLRMLLYQLALVTTGAMFAFALFGGMDGTTCSVRDDDSEPGTFCSVYNSGVCPHKDFFSTPLWSWYHLMVLMTTANFPDVMLPAYHCQKEAALFFIIYLVVGLYFLMNLVTAIVYNDFATRATDMMNVHSIRRKDAASRAYYLLASVLDVPQLPARPRATIGAAAATATKINASSPTLNWPQSSLRVTARRMMLDRILTSHDYCLSGPCESMKRKIGCCFKASEAIQWLVHMGVCVDKTVALAMCNQMYAYGHFTHCDNTYRFEPGSNMYRFHPALAAKHCDTGNQLGVSREMWRTLFADLESTNIRRCPGYLNDVVFDVARRVHCYDANTRKETEPKLEIESPTAMPKTEYLDVIQFVAAIDLITEIYVKAHVPTCLCLRLKIVTDDPNRYGFIGRCLKQGCSRRLAVVVRSKPWAWLSNGLALTCAIASLVVYQIDATASKEKHVVKDYHHIFQLYAVIFVLEMIGNMIGVGVIGLWQRSAFDRLDVAAIILAAGLNIFASLTENDSNDHVFKFLAYVRLLKILRVLGSSDRNVLFTSFSAIAGKLMRFVSVLLVLFYVYGCVGMELYGNALSPRNNADINATAFGALGYHGNDFDSPYHIFVLLFEQMVVNNWPVVMEGCFPAHGAVVAVIYFLSFHILCVLVISNVVVAFTIDAFDQESQETRQKILNAKMGVSARSEWRDMLDSYAELRGLHTSNLDIVRQKKGSGLNFYGSMNTMS